MSTNTKPRICEVLGVEDGEWFVFNRTSYKIEGLQLWSKSENYTSTVNSLCLIQIIENKESIIRKPHFTEDEVAFMRTLEQASPGVVILRDRCDMLFWYKPSERADKHTHLLPYKLFPFILPGTSITISDIIGQKENRPR